MILQINNGFIRYPFYILTARIIPRLKYGGLKSNTVLQHIYPLECVKNNCCFPSFSFNIRLIARNAPLLWYAQTASLADWLSSSHFTPPAALFPHHPLCPFSRNQSFHILHKGHLALLLFLYFYSLASLAQLQPCPR